MVNETSQMSSAGTGSAHTAAADPIASTIRPGGAPARVYMNEKIVPYLLEGMKTVTKEQYAAHSSSIITRKLASFVSASG